MSQDAYSYRDDQEDTIRCTLCGNATSYGDLCFCCHRCIDCVAECGHSRQRIVADEIENVNEF